jgi:hypothetical protein
VRADGQAHVAWARARGGEDLRRATLYPRASYDRGHGIETVVAFQQQERRTSGWRSRSINSITCTWAWTPMTRDILVRVRE